MSEMREIAAAEADSPVPGVKRPVFVLGVVSFLTDVSSEMVYPLVPLFLTSTLGAPLAAVGLIEGLGGGGASLFQGGGGGLAGRAPRALRRPHRQGDTDRPARRPGRGRDAARASGPRLRLPPRRRYPGGGGRAGGRARPPRRLRR